MLAPSRKLAWKHMGPFEVINKYGKYNYKLKLPLHMKIHPVFYIGDLMEYKQKDYPTREKLDRPTPEVINEEEEYEVQEILNCRKVRKRYYYLIKWKGYDSGENTWEPLGPGLSNATEAIQDFYKKYPKAEQPKGLDKWIAKQVKGTKQKEVGIK